MVRSRTPTFGNNGNTDQNPDDLCSGINVVTVTDANNCTLTAEAIVGNITTLVIDSVTEDMSVSCNGGNDGSATVNASGGQPPYSYAWDNMETDQTIVGLTAGGYNVTVTDADGCIAVGSVTVSEPTLLTASTNVLLDVLCNGENTGSAEVTPAGGTPPYTYEWDNGETDPIATMLDAGTHLVTITDANACTETASADIVQPAAALAITLDADSPSNCVSCDGSASITVSGGTAPYTYAWDNGNSAEDPADLCTGFNTLTVIDANGCESTLSVNIGNTSTLIVDSIVEENPVSCLGGNDGSATVNASGGQSPYTYMWEDGQTDATAVGLAIGPVNVTVTDNDGCVAAGSIDITQIPTLTASAVEDTPVICFGESNGQATVTPTGGTVPYTYLWDNAETDATATGLNAGMHSVTITDANGCETNATVDMTEPAELTATAIEDAPVICFGESNGQATVTPVGGIAPYTYEWDNTETDVTATALNAGTHTVTVTDANACTTTTTVDITEPAELTAMAMMDAAVICNGEFNGQATVAPSGGIAPYTYEWDNAETDAMATALNAGTHTVTVTDANACTTTTTVDITEPTELTATAMMDVAVLCNGESNGQATAAPSGGTAPYTYEWDNAETNITATALNAGTHTVTITDANACTTTTTVDITEPAPVVVTTIQDIPVACAGESNGQATATAMGGNLPYTYEWDNGETEATASALNAGTHLITVTDNEGCSFTASVDISEPVALTASAVQDAPVRCNGESTGVATVTAFDGTGPYAYSWDSGETTATATALNAGTHTVTVTDANLCTTTTTVNIDEPPVLATVLTSQPVSCFGGFDGQATAVVSGGTPPYTYNWDNGELSNPAVFLTAGPHTVIITDANGCQITGNVTIGSPEPLLPDLIESTPATCFGGNDGTATITVMGGTAPYTYTWSDGQVGSTAVDLPAGVIQVTIQDANGCSLPSINITINQPAESVSVTMSGTDPSCFDSGDGTITAVATGGTPSYQFDWSDGSVGPTAFNLTAGTYQVTVTDQNGCFTISSYTLGRPDPVAGSFSSTATVCYGDANGTITVDTAFGGTGPYIYSLDGQNYQTSNIFPGLTGGLYEVFIQDINGCEFMDQVLVDEPFEIQVNLGSDLTVILGDSTQLMPEVNTSDTLLYSWSPVTFLNCLDCENPVVTPLETTIYTVMVADTNGCTATDEIEISVDKSRDVFIPNAFSPNGDAVNDIFMIYSNQGVAQVRSFRIFDRWGEQMFEATNFSPNDPLFGWNGTFKGKTLNPAVFVYFAEVEFVDGVVLMYKGDVTLIK